ANYVASVPGSVAYARWSALSQLLIYIEQGNLFNSINFNLPPETPGMAGDVPVMPPVQKPRRGDATPSRTQASVFLCPSDFPVANGDWQGANNYLANQSTWACDLSENSPSTVSPSDQPTGIFYFQSSVNIAGITDGTSNTAFFSEKIRGTGVRDA